MPGPVITRKRCCCASTCTICPAIGDPGDPGYVPPLVCDPQTSLSITIASLTTFDSHDGDEAFNSDEDGTFFRLEWGSHSVFGTFCLHAAFTAAWGCTTMWVSNGPVASCVAAVFPDDPDLRREVTVDFYAYVTFNCDGLIRTEIIGSAFGVDVLLFSTEAHNVDSNVDNREPWTRSCVRSGYTMTNAFATTNDYLNFPDGPNGGTGGTVTTGGTCAVENCQICAATSLLVSVDTTPEAEALGVTPYHESYVLDQVAGCLYAGEGVNDAGAAVDATISFSIGSDAYGFITTLQPGESGGTPVSGSRRCDGTATSVLGAYAPGSRDYTVTVS